MMGSNTWAVVGDEFTENGINYKVISESPKEVEVISNSPLYIGNIVIPSTANGYSVTAIGNFSFELCSDLSSITIPNSVKSIGEWAFAECEGLTSVTIPNGVTSIGYGAFYHCSELSSIEIPASVTSIGDNAFDYCYDLTVVELNSNTIVSKDYDSNSGLNSIFGSQVKKYILGEDITSIGSYAFSHCWQLPSFTIPASVTSIGNNAFYGCLSLTKVELNSNAIVSKDYDSNLGLSSIFGRQVKGYVLCENITRIGNYAFSGCSNLPSITIPASVTSIGDNAFDYCTQLAQVIVPNIGNWCKIEFSSSSSNPLSYAHHLYQDEDTEVTELVIPDDITSIGDYAFYGCSALTSVTIGNNVESIGASAFSGCSKLSSITIPASVTSIGNNAFKNCTQLAQVIVPNIGNWCKIEFSSSSSNPLSYAHHLYQDEDTEVTELVIPDDITSIGDYAFYGCSALTSVTIGNNVESIGASAFLNCSSLTKVELNSNAVISKNYNSQSGMKSFFGSQVTEYILGEDITSIGSYAFYSCSKLSSITIPASVTSIGNNAFKNCTQLAQVIVPNIGNWCKIEFSSSSSNPLSYAHHLYQDEDTEVTEIVIPDDITSIGDYTFYGCSALTSVTIGNSVESIGTSAFQNCSSLTSIEIPSCVTSIGNGAFSGCNNMTEVNLNSNAIVSKDYDSNSGLKGIFGVQVTEYVLCENITRIGNNAFSGCSNLPSITIPAAVTSIGDNAFSGCISPFAIHISDLESWCNIQLGSFISNSYSLYMNGEEIKDLVVPSTITSIGNMFFSNCTGLTSIEIPNSVTSIGYQAFSGCRGLTSVSIGNGVTSIGNDAFYGCSNLSMVHIANLDAWSNINFVNAWSNPLYIAHHMYINGEEIVELAIPEGITSVGNYAFMGGSSFISAIIPNSVTAIGISAFEGCTGLTSINIGNGVTTIGRWAFNRCTGLTSVNLSCEVIDTWLTGGNSLPSLTEIILGEGVKTVKENAFRGCANIKTIDIGSTITSIEARAFSGSDKLTDVTCRATTIPETDRTAFENSYPDYATLHVPRAALSAYQETAPWSGFKNIVRIAMPTYALTYVVDDEEYKTYQLEEGEPITPEDEPTKEGYTFSGWSELPETMPAHDVTITGTFSINSYKLTYQVDGEVYKSIDVEYGETITPEDEPTKEGYTFSGWSEIPETMPAHDVTITGTFSINSYKLTYMIDNEVYKETIYKYGETITPEPQPEGNYETFEWVDLPETMPAHDVVVYANYTTTGIADILKTKQQGIKIYSPNGKMLDNPQKGLNIIRMNDGSTRKVVIK